MEGCELCKNHISDVLHLYLNGATVGDYFFKGKLDIFALTLLDFVIQEQNC